MTLSCCRRAYSPRVKSSRRAGVAGGVGEGEVVAAGGVRGGDAAFLSNNVDLEKVNMSGYNCDAASNWAQNIIT